MNTKTIDTVSHEEISDEALETVAGGEQCQLDGKSYSPGARVLVGDDRHELLCESDGQWRELPGGY